MKKRIYPVLAVGLLILSACDINTVKTEAPRIGGSGSASVGSPSKAPDGDALPTTVDIGNPLFAAAEYEAPVAPSGDVQADPIVVPQCHVNTPFKQDLPSEVDGKLLWIGRPLRNGDAIPADPFESRRVLTDPFDDKSAKTFLRLRIGDRVEEKDLLAVIDNTLAVLGLKSAVEGEKSAKQETIYLMEQTKFYKAELDIVNETAKTRGSTSKSEVNRAEAQYASSKAQQYSKMEAEVKAGADRDIAATRLDKHLIPAAIGGRVLTISKNVGEAVKPGDSILTIQDTQHIQVEGFVEASKFAAIKDGMTVLVQPNVRLTKTRTMPAGANNKPITSLATAYVNDTNLVLAAGEDGNVYVWDLKAGVRAWKHREAVRAVACTAKGVEKPFAVTGCDDGKARVFALDTVVSDPKLTLDGHHAGGVYAVAISPDGHFCVTSDERDIFMSDAVTGKRLYTFPRLHVQTVVKLSFTPQGRVVSVGRENDSIIVWKVGEKGADRERGFEHRTGEVPYLGVTEDGNRMLVDLDQTRLNVVTLGDGQTESTLQIPIESGKFAGLAMLSPKLNDRGERVIITTGQSDGTVQMWKNPTSQNRGAEIRNLVCEDRAPATAAAFSVDGPKGFVVVGTKKGAVYLWRLPDEAELKHEYRAVIRTKGGQIESNGNSVKIVAEMENPSDSWELLPGTGATIVIQPK